MAPTRPSLEEVQSSSTNRDSQLAGFDRDNSNRTLTKASSLKDVWDAEGVQVLLDDDDDSTVASSTSTSPTRVNSPFASNNTTISSVTHPSDGRRMKNRKVAFLAHGTLGDYLPAALVAGQLSKRGYATIFMAPASVQYLIKDHPEIRFVDFGISMQDARERTEEGERLNHLHFHDHRRKVVDWIGVMEKDWAPRLIRFLEVGDLPSHDMLLYGVELMQEEEKPDLVVTTLGTLTFLSPLIEAFNIPTVSLLANPMHMTGEHLPTCGPQVMRTLHIPAVNKFWWRYMFSNTISMARYNLVKRVLPQCRELDPTLADRFRTLKLKQSRNLDFPKLILCSPSFYPAPKDWDRRTARVIGVAWPPDEIRSFARKAEVESFVTEHQGKVAYIGFGSMLAVYRENKHRLRLLQAAVSACLTAGLAVIVSTSGARGFTNQDPSMVLVLGDELVPHGWLFPRCTLIMHHGGSGTTHMALKAAVPQVVVPFMFPTWYYNGVEQGFWSRQVKHAGVGAGVLHANLAYKYNILPLVHNALRPEIKRRAEEVAKQIRAEEDGLTIATEILDKLLQDDPRANGVDLSKY